jgi:hypothetical protein
MKTMMEAWSEKMEAKLETNQEKTERIKVIQVLTALQGRFLMFYMKSLKEQHTRRLSWQLRTDLETSDWPQGTTIN